MYTYLIIFGLGAITFVIEKKLAKTQDEKNVFMLIEYLMYTFIDFMVTFLLLNPIGRVTIIQVNTGMYEIVYGTSAIIISLIVSVICGIVFAFINKNVKCNVKIDKQ